MSAHRIKQVFKSAPPFNGLWLLRQTTVEEKMSAIIGRSTFYGLWERGLQPQNNWNWLMILLWVPSTLMCSWSIEYCMRCLNSMVLQQNMVYDSISWVSEVRHNSSALTMKLHLSCTNPSISYSLKGKIGTPKCISLLCHLRNIDSVYLTLLKDSLGIHTSC